MSEATTKPTSLITSTAPLEESIAGYTAALTELESASLNPSLEQIVKVLVARDEVEKIRVGTQNLTGESIARLIRLDNRLKSQAHVISTHESLSEWKENPSIPPTYWWWHLKSPGLSPDKPVVESTDANSLLQEAIKRCDRSLARLEKTRRRYITEQRILEVLLARDEVAQYQREEQLPAKTLLEITQLDQRLKKQRLTILRTKALPTWKSCLNPPPENWWWDLKLNLLGSEDEPMTVRERLWIVGAVVTTVIAAAILLNTGQVFKVSGGDKNGVQADTLQYTLFGLQTAQLTAVVGFLTTGKGRQALERLLINTPFVRPNWQAPGLFGVSCIVLGTITGIHHLLPELGNFYLSEGNKLVEKAQFSQAQQNYLQAKKLFAKDEDLVKVSLALGKVYEYKVDFIDAIEEYKSSKGTDNPEILNRLGKAILLQEMRKVGWKQAITDLEQLNDAENYIERAHKKIQHDSQTDDPRQNKFNPQDLDKSDNDAHQELVIDGNDDHQKVTTNRILKEIKINQGILAWAQVDFQALDANYSKLLKEAEEKFKEAAQYEENLPTTPDDREARCYAILAEKLYSMGQKKQGSNNHKNELIENKTNSVKYCKTMKERSLNDPSDALMMQAVWDVIESAESAKEVQSISLNHPNSIQASN